MTSFLNNAYDIMNCFAKFWLSSRNFFQGVQNLLLCKFLLLCYCFRTKFQGGAKVSRGANCLRGASPYPPHGRKPEFEKFLPYSIIMPSFMTVGGQMPELAQGGGGRGQKYILGCQNTPFIVDSVLSQKSQ